SRLTAITFVLAASLAALAACGGSTGTGGPPPTSAPSPTATPVVTPTVGPMTTNATGTVLSDPAGTPMSGVRVVLMPWAPCGPTPAPNSITAENDGCPTPLPSPQVTTAPNGTFALNGVPNGHYLLVIGSDSTSDATTATIHDNITLTGGNQALVAPTLPAIPSYTVPAVETGGSYRLLALNANEVPCLTAWQTDRTAIGVFSGVEDEWLAEQVRDVNGWVQTGAGAGKTYNPLTIGNTNVSGGSAPCSSALFSPPSILTTSFAPYGNDPRTLWFAGTWSIYQGGLQASGIAEFPIDPRSFTDPNYPNWP
ncbi:MAG: carboxypeptidase-like regulatory domain-containing protein, partial [Acidobacteriaceae bacterium]